MKFIDTDVVGGYLVEPHRIEDDRGYFARAWCADEMQEHGLIPRIVQSNMAVSRFSGTLRGLHYQSAPALEAKFIRCVRGRIYDVMLDLRPDSPSYLKWFGAELSPDNAHALYIPEGCATGYLTLADDCEIYYHATHAFAPEHAHGVRWDDPAFGIKWPTDPQHMSEQDRQWPDYQPKR